MKSKQKRRSEPNSVKKVLVVVVSTVLALIGLAMFTRPQEVKNTPLLVEPRGNSPYSSQTLTTFWEDEIRPIAQQWATASFPYPELNARSTYLASKIQERTRKSVYVHASFDYHPKIKSVTATTGLDTNRNQVTVILRIPALMDSFRKLKNSGQADWRATFQTYLTITLMHELEHGGHEDLFLKLPVSLDEESRAWAETCRHAIVPLVERHGIRMDGIDQKFYSAWKKSAGNIHDPTWRQVLQEYYGML